MNPHKLSALAICGAVLAGCASEPESHVVSAPPPGSPVTGQQVVVTQQPQQQIVTTVAPANTGASYVVLQAPPAPQAPQAIPPQPSSQYVWLDGYWTWQNNRYEWMAGHWEVPPFAGARWQSPHAVSENGAYRFYEGRWI